jgi:hypothetical protein
MEVDFLNISFFTSSYLFLFWIALYSFIEIVSVGKTLIGDRFLTHPEIVHFATPYLRSK